MINNTILKLVQDLSLQDTKTLSQKGLKLSEECGELSKKILAYENADGSRHKIFQKEDILEEAVDSMLVSLSVAYSLGYTDDDISSMMKDKAFYWSKLKNNDNKNGKYPYEIHFTLEYTPVKGLEDMAPSANLFSNVGNIKVIMLELFNPDNSISKQLTTSSIVHGSYNDVLVEATRIKDILKYYEESGYKIIREKHETVPWHPICKTPKLENYFETHFTFLIDSDKLENLQQLCKGGVVKLSRNCYKKTMDDNVISIMGTYREHGGLQNHEWMVERIKYKFSENNVTIKKLITEYALFDTLESLDDKWLKS